MLPRMINSPGKMLRIFALARSRGSRQLLKDRWYQDLILLERAKPFAYQRGVASWNNDGIILLPFGPLVQKWLTLCKGMLRIPCIPKANGLTGH